MTEYINNEFLANLRRQGKAKLAKKIEEEFHSKLQKARDQIKKYKTESNIQECKDILGLDV